MLFQDRQAALLVTVLAVMAIAVVTSSPVDADLKTPECLWRTDPANPWGYLQEVDGHWLPRMCARETQWDVSACGCGHSNGVTEVRLSFKTPNNLQDNDAPEEISVTFNSNDGSKSGLRLKKTDVDTSDIAVVAISTGPDGSLVTRHEKLSNLTRSSIYMDDNSEAMLEVRNNGKGLIKNGRLVMGNQSMKLKHPRQTGEEIGELTGRQTGEQTGGKSGEQTGGSYTPSVEETFDITPGDIEDVPLTDGVLTAPIDEDYDYDYDYSVNLRSQKREPYTGEYYVDVVAVVDFKAYTKFKDLADENETVFEEIRDYYAFCFYGIDLRYKGIPGPNRIRVRLGKIVVLTTPEASSITENNFWKHKDSIVNANLAIRAFRDFVRKSDDNLIEFDHAMLFTGYELNDGSSDLNGIAWQDSVCQKNGYSTSVIHERGNFALIDTMSHELAHSFGVVHDNAHNDCSDGFIMQVWGDSGTELYTWSKCSAKRIHDFIASQMDKHSYFEKCMKRKVSPDSDIPNVDDRLPGSEISTDEQCKRSFGEESRVCSKSQATGTMCAGIYCWNPDKNKCAALAPVRGTPCGGGKVCIQGHCVYDNATTVKPPTTAAVATTTTTKGGITQQECKGGIYKAVGFWSSYEWMHNWCKKNCNAGNCKYNLCKCEIVIVQAATTMSVWTPTTMSVWTPGMCKAVGFWKSYEWMNKRCQKRCNADQCNRKSCKWETTTTTTTTECQHLLPSKIEDTSS